MNPIRRHRAEGVPMRTASLCLGLLLLLLACPAPAQKSQLKKTKIDQSVDKAVEFLHNTQKNDGSWTAGRMGSSHVGITGLSVMAMLSAGHVPGEGKYGKTISKGVEWMLAQQKSNGLFASDNGHEMYHHGIATLMLAEVCGMLDKERGKEVRKAVEKAVLLILKAQRTSGSARGGWRYTVHHSNGSDISVTGWQIMALRAAKNLGCDVPAKNIEEAVAYVKSCQDTRGGGFRYTPGGQITVPCTGTSILALELCGKDEHKSPEVLKAGAYLVRTNNLPRWGDYHFFYSIYYGSQATFQLGGNYWSAYRTRLHFVLQQNQGSSGSWLGQGYDANYGPNYCTAMAVLALTVEYRFLPIYQRGEEPNEKEKEKEK
jgi:squalene cyclase